MSTTEAKSATPTVIEAILAVQKAVGPIAKNRTPDQGPQFKYRSGEDLINGTKPHLDEHGVVVTPEKSEVLFRDQVRVKDSDWWSVVVRVTWRIFGPAGDSIEVQTLGEGRDNAEKAVTKAEGIAHREMFAKTFTVCTEERADDAQRPEGFRPALELIATTFAIDANEEAERLWKETVDNGAYYTEEEREVIRQAFHAIKKRIEAATAAGADGAAA